MVVQENPESTESSEHFTTIEDIVDPGRDPPFPEPGRHSETHSNLDLAKAHEIEESQAEQMSQEQNRENEAGEEENTEEEEFQLGYDEEFDPSKLARYRILHLRTPRYAPFWVYYAELGHKTTLVLLPIFVKKLVERQN